MNRAESFHEVVAPFFKDLGRYTLVECCAGDGKGGAEFDKEPNVERVVFVDIREHGRFKRNLSKPFEIRCDGLENLQLEDKSVLIAIHSCGILTDIILEKAIQSGSAVAVMPCCYNRNMKHYNLRNPPDKRRLIYPSTKDYYDAFRLQYLRESGFEAILRSINHKITPMNNILIGIPNN